MTNSEKSKQIPLKNAIAMIDSIVAVQKVDRKERLAMDLSMLRISEAAQYGEEAAQTIELERNKIADLTIIIAADKTKISELEAKIVELEKQ